MRRRICDSHRFGSFAGVREGNAVKWRVPRLFVAEMRPLSWGARSGTGTL